MCSSLTLTCRVACATITLHALPIDSALLWLIGVGIPVVPPITSVGIVAVLLVAVAVVTLLGPITTVCLLHTTGLAKTIARWYLHMVSIRSAAIMCTGKLLFIIES